VRLVDAKFLQVLLHGAEALSYQLSAISYQLSAVSRKEAGSSSG